MLNITGRLDASEREFIQEVATVFAAMGMPNAAGRLYGYLLLKDVPMTLDDIAEDLAISKTSAWNAARMLERYGQIQRHGLRGGKRAYFSASQNFATAFHPFRAMLRNLATTLEARVSRAGPNAASAKLHDKVRFIEILERKFSEATTEFGQSELLKFETVGANERL